MELLFTVDGNKQSIIRTDSNEPLSDSIKFLTAKFTVTGMSGMTVIPTFSKTGYPYTPELTQTETDGTITVTCEVPWEVIKPYQFVVSATGINASTGERITTGTVTIEVKASGYANGNGVTTPSKSMIEQWLAELAAAGVTPEQIASAVATYMADHPIEVPTETDITDIVTSYVTEHKSELNGKSAYELAVADGYVGTEAQWIQSLVGIKGDTGKGVASISKTATNYLVDTYTITYTDSTTTTFNVTNGAIGASGKGIASISKTSTSGLVDTYTITYTDSSTITYTVTNGAKGNPGEKGDKGDTGAAGADGKDMTVQGETVTDTGAVTKALTANKFCNFTGAVTTLTINLPATYNPWDEFNFVFTTDSTGGNLALPSTVSWLGGTAPTLSASIYYECSIVNNKAVIAP